MTTLELRKWIKDHPGKTYTDVASMTGVSIQTVTRILDKGAHPSRLTEMALDKLREEPKTKAQTS